jgi:hypothetical protein
MVSGFSVQVSGNSFIAHRLEARKLGSQNARSDEAFEPSSIQAFQPSSYFPDTRLRGRSRFGAAKA